MKGSKFFETLQYHLWLQFPQDFSLLFLFGCFIIRIKNMRIYAVAVTATGK